MIRNFIMGHSMRLAMFNDFSKFKLLAVADTRFASMIVMLKRFKLINLQLAVKEKLLDDTWWALVDYILTFTDPIYTMLRFCDTDKPCFHSVYEIWDDMILQVKKSIFAHERKLDFEESNFWNVVRVVLEDRWSKSNNPLHCLAHSLNPK
ncbi:hypothetical protein ACJIZ3_005914 [Penstemon smallii]|uniref:Uncharacterized protein n=1 Tax=Penstemon smallii TaxID=265156 RepID=A0ABD3S676_9LAMI